VRASNLDQVDGKWVRFNSYQVVNGIVCPHPTATLVEYDPWEQFRSNSGKYRTVEQPYLSLLRLDDVLAYLKRERADQTVLEHAVLSWCSKYGLLGLTPVLKTYIAIGSSSYHFRNGGRWLTRTADSQTGVQRISVPENAGLSSEIIYERPSRTLSTSEKELLAAITSAKSVLLERIRQLGHTPFARLLDDGPSLDRVNTESSAVLHRPHSREFWLEYGEPVDHIAAWAETFARSVRYVSQRVGERRERGTQVIDVIEAQCILSSLAEGVTPTFVFSPETDDLNERRLASGLLASYALMFLWDRIDGRGALQCQNCGEFFVSDEPRAQYCSPRCRNTAQSRRYRLKKVITRDAQSENKSRGRRPNPDSGAK
jgi:hypothetical protein